MIVKHVDPALFANDLGEIIVGEPEGRGQTATQAERDDPKLVEEIIGALIEGTCQELLSMGMDELALVSKECRHWRDMVIQAAIHYRPS